MQAQVVCSASPEEFDRPRSREPQTTAHCRLQRSCCCRQSLPPVIFVSEVSATWQSSAVVEGAGNCRDDCKLVPDIVGTASCPRNACQLATACRERLRKERRRTCPGAGQSLRRLRIFQHKCISLQANGQGLVFFFS